MHEKSVICTWNTSLYGYQPSAVFLGMQSRNFWTRITSLSGSHSSHIVLCMQYCMIITRITSLCRSQPLPVVFACKTATFGEELQVSMGRRHPLSYCECNTAWLAPELLVSLGPSPHLWCLHAQQGLLDQHTSLHGYQTSPVVLCMQNSVISTRITRLYGFQP